MNPPHPTLDPHLEEVLRDIEADPKARLFRISPRQLLRTLRDRDPVIGTRQVGLSTAERELLEVHREEVARLLYDTALADLYGGRHGRIALGRWVTSVQEVHVPSRSELQRRHQYLTSLPEVGGDAQARVILLEEHLGSAIGGRPDGVRLLLNSLRLAARSRTRIALALALMAREEDEKAAGVLNAVLERRSSTLTHAIALGNLAYVRQRQGNDLAALELSGASRIRQPDRIGQLLNEFAFALRVGDAERVIATGQRMHDLVGETHPAVEQFIELRGERKRLPAEAPTTECLRLLSRLTRNELKPAAERIANVYR